MSGDDFLKLISQISGREGLVVYLVDIFDFSGSWVPGLQRFIGKNPVLMVGNKLDLLPKSTNPNKLTSWLRRSAKDLGLRPLDVLLMSAEKNLGIDQVIEKMNYYRKGKDIYIVGVTNVGKSTFINHLIRAVGQEDATITTSHFPGTTLDFIGIPLDDGQMLYDTPGIVNLHQAAHFISEKDYSQVMPTKEIKPVVFQLNEEQTLFIGGMGRIDYIGPGRRSLIVYASNRLTVHRTRTDHADDLFRRQYGLLLSPPSRTHGLPELKSYEFHTDGLNTDIVFSGLGWVTVKGRGAQIRVSAPASISVSQRTSIIKG